MGRPPLNVLKMTIRIEAETRKRIETLVGKNRVAAFARRALENELARLDPEGKTKPQPAEKKARRVKPQPAEKAGKTKSE